jgi:aminobenzoyl-glutamate transport protein
MGGILAINGAQLIQGANLPPALIVAAMVILAALLNIFIGSASAKWAAISPILVPMLMLLGISPEMSTAAYRVGDSVTNIITPLMVYFPHGAGVCRRWIQNSAWAGCCPT